MGPVLAVIDSSSGNDDTETARIDYAKFVIEHNVSFINLADTKAGILLGINGIVLALLFGIDKTQLSSLSSTLFLFTSVFLAGSSFFAILTIIPRLTQAQNSSRIYFMSIVQKSKDEFLKDWRELKQQDILRDLGENIHNLAKIQSKKFKYLQVSILLIIVGIGLLVVSLFSYVLTNLR